MRVLFICGSLEPGRDGVGDYCRLIAEEFAKMNNEVMVLSLFDTYLETDINILEESRTGTTIQIRRISSKLDPKKKFSLTKEWIQAFNPQWISLHYVPYSFHKRGMNLHLPGFFLRIKGNYNWHLMIHEAWVTNKYLLSTKSCIGYVQMYILKFLVKYLQPNLIHTTNAYYQKILLRRGVRSEMLHLPSNIPFIPCTNDQLEKGFEDIGIFSGSRKKWLFLGSFGRIRPNVSYLALMGKILDDPETQERRIGFLSIGNAGFYADKLSVEIQKKFMDKVVFYQLGHKGITDISIFFQMLDYGVASVPKHLLGKSGAYAAMRNHGLKILVPEPTDPTEKIISKENSPDYLLEIPDEDFAPKKVAQELWSVLESTMSRKKNQIDVNENFIYQS